METLLLIGVLILYFFLGAFIIAVALGLLAATLTFIFFSSASVVPRIITLILILAIAVTAIVY